jgi:hypothetical protein
VEPVDLHVLADGPHGFLPLQKPTSPLSLPSPTGSSSQMTTSRLGASASRRMGSALVWIVPAEGEWARQALAVTARLSPPHISRSTGGAALARG